MLPLAGNEEFRGRGRVRVRSKNENDSGGPRERKPRPRLGSFLVARNRSSIVLVLVLVSAIGCKGEDVGVPKSNKLALTGFQPWEALSKRICPEGARDHGATDGSITRAIWSPFRALRWGDTVPRVETLG